MTTERVRRINPTELEDVITIHDPEYYSRDCQALRVQIAQSYPP
jgi:hypothetical protein